MLLSFLFLLKVAFPATYYVKKDGSDGNSGTSWSDAFLTITKALDKVSYQDVVWVAEGTYQEGNVLTIPELVWVYGGFSGNESDLSQRDIENHKTIIDGEESYGCINNSGVVDGLYVTNGHISGRGGGIYNNGTVTNCTVYWNRTHGCSCHGAGIYNCPGCSVTNCTVYGNTMDFGGYGDGGGIYNSERCLLINCTVYDNSADNGGGIYNYSGSVTNCTVYGNTAKDYGGGIYNFGRPVTNCISWNNVNGDYYGNLTDVSYSCFGESVGNNHNIRVNPLFFNTSGDRSTWDFRLQNGSPCIDTANPDMAPYSDLDGNPRPGADGKVCMGAYESPDDYEPAPPRPPIRLYVKKDGNNTDGSSWENAYMGITIAISNLAGDNSYDIWIAEGVYQEGASITIPGRVSIYGGFMCNETDLSQRDIENHKTIIDGEKSYGCFKNYGLVDGLYLTNGNHRGIYNVGTVTSCMVYNNKSDFGGGGIYNRCGFVNKCTVNGNNAESGGGVYNYLGTVMNTKVNNNLALYGNGGGICNHGGIVTNCMVFNNVVECNHLGGGGIYNFGGTVTNCTLYSNTATGSYSIRGGWIYNSNGTVTNCTVYGNTSNSGGGGIDNSSGYVTNCISWNNGSRDIYKNLTDVSYSCFGESRGDNHNINSDPLLINTSGDPSTWDFHLQDGSPCIDTGTSVGAPEYDMDGIPRPQGTGFDMGAYEYPSDNAEFISQDAPSKINVGEDSNVSIIMKNIGSNTWSKGGGYRLGDCGTTDSLWGLSRVDLAPGVSVAMDEITSFTFTITAPGKEGEYDFQWQMVKEPEKKWFGQKTPLVRIKVIEKIPGDVNDDGYLTILDVNLLRDHLLGIRFLDPNEAERADANLNGELDVCDMICIVMGRSD